MKMLNGSELAGYIKQRQAKQVRSLNQSQGIFPKLAIVKTHDDPVINSYIRLKKQYGQDIGVEVFEQTVEPSALIQTIEELNADENTHGVIVQLPIGEGADLNEVLNSVDSMKDVDGLSDGSEHTAATAQAIGWLLDGYNVELNGKKIALVGHGRLVGGPLEKELNGRGFEPMVLQEGDDLSEGLKEADVVISATGVPGLIDSAMLAQGAVAVDAGVATDNGKTVGDFDSSVYERDDLTLTPKKGGVGPLTVSALFENLLRASS